MNREVHARFCERPRGQFPRPTHHKNGFVVWYKVIEGKERFHWPRRSEEAVVTFTGEQLEWLLQGYDVTKMKPHQALNFSHVS